MAGCSAGAQRICLLYNCAMHWAAKSYEQPQEDISVLSRAVPAAVGGALMLATVMVALCTSHAQTALVQSVTLNAMREAARVYLQEINTDTGALTPLATQIAGDASAGPVYTLDDGTAVTIATREYGAPTKTLVAFSPTAPVNQNLAWRALDGRESILAGVANNGAAGPRAISARAIDAGPVRGQGQIEMWPLSAGMELPLSPATWLLPGAPASAVTHKSAGWVAVLCRLANGAVVLHVRDTARGRVIQERVSLAGAHDGRAPAALTLTNDGTVLFAVLNDTSPGDGEGRCWIAPLDARSFSPIGPPFELDGMVESSDGVAATHDNSCWIASRSPSAGFAYINEIARTENRYEMREYRTHTGISRRLFVYAANSAVAVAVNNHVEVWRDGKANDKAISLETPVTALSWVGETLLVGEANRIHAIAPDGSELWTTRMQTGHISSINPLALAYDEKRFKDDDGDMLANAIDPYPDSPTSWITLPTEIAFREDAAGVETRAVRIASENADNALWRVDFDAELSPWLRVFPRQGRVPGWFVAGVDPSQLAPHGQAQALVDVFLSTFDSPQQVAIRLLPRSRASRSVLWLLSQHTNNNSYEFDALENALSGPPFYWSHEHSNNAIQSIDDFAAIVLNTDAIEAGFVSRQELFDYVSRGGGLLVIARERDKEQHWLAPAGIVIGAGHATGGLQASATAHTVLRHFNQIKMGSAARVQTDAAFTVLATVGDAPAFAVRQFGRGRIALLASPSPVVGTALKSTGSRYFATDLFDWLSRSVIETKDADADGLPDKLEDRNGNGVIDAGETSKLDPDSDGDGIPDGKEDRNANGKVDAGETDSLNTDTDGDGDRDGADFTPLPPTSTLANEIGSIELGDGPINEHAASVLDDKTDGARGPVTVLLEGIASTDAPLEGTVSVSFAAPPGADVGRAVLRLDTQPPGELEWFDLRTTAEAELSGRRVIQQESREWGVAFEITAPARSDNAMQLVTVRVRSRNTIADMQSATIVARDIEIYAANGERLATNVTGTTIVWNESATP